ncbi:hypothetical protein Y032_0087g2115 [Ancylostoma ceylanicum]|uniref:Uncharacterized protein n=1 Tax=Ancylostoma ceylanicum TaxID=53326 RepID=A0A016TPS2_9BILA|nr:hypothetical protein Y032_0087g2115 [Ancylostoma ceylanicum]
MAGGAPVSHPELYTPYNNVPSIICFTEEDIWRNAIEKKSAIKCADIGEGAEKNRYCARMFSCRRVWNRL